MPGPAIMSGRFSRFAVVVVLLLLAAWVAEPYVTRLMLSDTAPRLVTARGNLSEAEQTIIAIFQQVSPSVVQVVGRQAGGDSFSEEGEGVQSGTGFIWDGAGNIVTNNHVVSGTSGIAVRLASGEVMAAEIVGTAPNYDLAVIRLRGTATSPGNLCRPPALIRQREPGTRQRRAVRRRESAQVN